MNLRLFAAVSFSSLLAVGCNVGDANPQTGVDAPVVVVDAPPAVGNLITADETWSGTKVLTDTVTIAAGVTVTVEAGTNITGPAGKNLRVRGTLKVNGTAASRVSLKPTSGIFAGVVVETGGTANVAYFDASQIATVFYVHAGATLTLDHADISDISKAVDVGGGTATVTRSKIQKMQNGGANLGSGTLTIRDSLLLESTGDIVVALAGALTIEYSEIGGATSIYEHCNLHIGGDVTIKVTHNNIRSSVVGLMFYGGTNADFTFNNWYENEADLDPAGGAALAGRTGNFANSYWVNPPVATTGATFMPMSATKLTDAGVRPE
ncbi:MAG: hypothetical protein KBG15_16975 [Kofleriaceae bacterium]|nr:hypothetical protein [Kofleriaceae bacterium]